jgi:hypothetical protein
MRSISAAGLAKIMQTKGTEPILIFEVDWSVSATVAYADRDIGTEVKGRVLEVGDLDADIDVLNANSSQELEVVLDDTDGSIKSILDSQDVHQRDVRVYQWFAGLDLEDKFLLFAGKVSSPVIWSEADRTVRFSILSQLEDKEFGFSAEEGQFPFIPNDMVGKPWPVIFGTCLDVPALQVNKAVSGSTLCGIGIISGEDLHNDVPLGGTDCSLGISLANAGHQISVLNIASSCWAGVNDEQSDALREQANEIRSQLALMVAGRASQQECAQTQRQSKLDTAIENGLGCNPVRILGGEDFPQNTPITLNINGGLFTGIMSNDQFTISTRFHPDNEEKAELAHSGIADAQCETPAPPQFFDFSQAVPPGTGNAFGNDSVVRSHGFIICNEPHKSRPSIPQVAQHFWAEPGSRAVMFSDEEITYIVSITPGTVLAVKAFKTLNGERKLVNVPNDLWRAETAVYGTITAVQVVLRRPLSTIVDQGWDDDIYVTFQNPLTNMVDILDYIITNYTDLSRDAASFLATRTLVTPFPMNFPILDRRNTLDLIKDIAFQARCAIWLTNGVFYLKYLPESPSVDQTVSVSSIESGSVEVELTPTEDLITKMVIKWWLSYAADEPNKIILRHNINKYGTKQREYDFFCYNQPDIILKVATFWLIRKSNTWKKLRFRGFLDLLQLESFDTIELLSSGQSYVASTDIKCVVQRATYDSNSNTIQFECEVPVKAGTTVEYQFFWPSSLSVTNTFPTPAEIAAGNAGGDGIGAGATGTLPIGFTDGISSGGTVFVGGPNVVFRATSDRGDPTPTDVGFTAQTIIPPTVFAEVETSVNPNPDLSLNYVDPIPPMQDMVKYASDNVIDIRRTKIVDSANGTDHAFLISIIREILNEELIIATSAKFGDGENAEEFDFEFDAEGSKFGAGTAFLKDD